MGLGGISPGSLLLILIIALVIFGSKKIGTLGEDLGRALKDFKKGLSDVNDSAKAEDGKSQEEK